MKMEESKWRYTWIEHTVANMEEREREGQEEVTLQIWEFQHILSELLAAHRHSDRLEEVLISYAKYAFPTPLLVPPVMFGGTESGRYPTASGAVEQIEKKEPTDDYDVCADCGMSDVYYNWAYNKRYERRAGLKDRRCLNITWPEHLRRHQESYVITKRSRNGDRRKENNEETKGNS
jgi:hypothetical protein